VRRSRSPTEPAHARPRSSNVFILSTPDEPEAAHEEAISTPSAELPPATA
jgi:hypothetical protein